jgi:ABC-2 type transport system ATP-binding protein
MQEVIAVAGLTKRFGEITALDGVTFSLSGPQLVCILGPNGAGKTTLLDLLEGLTRADAGELKLFGTALRDYPRERVGVVLQKEFILDAITVGEYADLFAAIQRVSGGGEKILQQSRLESRSKTPLQRISNGEAQRLFIAAAAVHRPDLLFLDEPTAHLDPNGKLEIATLLKELARERTIIMTTHDLREADAIASEVLFLVDGKLKAQGSRAALIEAHGTLEGAFFHHSAARITARGDMEPA